MKTESNFIEFNNTKRIWAIGSIHSNYNSLKSINNHIEKNFTNGDKLVFLGNIIGLGKNAKETLSSVIDMTCMFSLKFFLSGLKQQIPLTIKQIFTPTLLAS